MQKLINLLIILVSATFVSFSTVPLAQGQGERKAQCNIPVKGEFSQQAEDHIYQIYMEPSQRLKIAVKRTGERLKTVIVLYDPAGVRIIGSSPREYRHLFLVSDAPTIDSGLLSARGNYQIRVANATVDRNYDYHPDIKSEVLIANDSAHSGGIGEYDLIITCENEDGSRVESSSQATVTSQNQSATAENTLQTSHNETGSSIVEVGKNYEVTFGVSTEVMAILEVRSDGWAKVDRRGKISWLNINQVVLITPLED